MAYVLSNGHVTPKGDLRSAILATAWFLLFQTSAHPEIKLKQNTETAWNSFRIVSAALTYWFACWKIC